MEAFILTTFTLKCRECGKHYPPKQLYVCEDCFAPLDVIYDYETLSITKETFQNRPKNMWRYLDLLPIMNPLKIVNLDTGYTPLLKAKRLGKILGLKNLYVKNDTVNPTYSFKDRPVAIAISKALEFKAEAIGCASTGNLAAASAAHAAKAGLPCYVFVPNDTEHTKIIQIAAYGASIMKVNGTYDEANRLAMQVAEEYNWVFANFNVRPYYVEGSKTLAYEVCEQLNWESPDHVIVPTGSGALLCAVNKGFKEFQTLRLIDDKNIKISCAQPHGCSPIVSAYKHGDKTIEPVEYPNTIAKSLAIGDPGDGRYALETVRASRGFAESATNTEIVNGIRLLAKCEGIFAEPAGGITVAVLKKLVEDGLIAQDERIVCYITGNGLKTTEAVINTLTKPLEIQPQLSSFREVVPLKEIRVWSK